MSEDEYCDVIALQKRIKPIQEVHRETLHKQAKAALAAKGIRIEDFIARVRPGWPSSVSPAATPAISAESKRAVARR